ncbi:unnamed protein product, partial [Linum tenue]
VFLLPGIRPLKQELKSFSYSKNVHHVSTSDWSIQRLVCSLFLLIGLLRGCLCHLQRGY